MSAEVENKEEVVQQGVHNYSAVDTYVKPTDPAVLEKLEWFQDQKLALMIHWGIYCQLGIVASWALSDKDADWSRHQVNWTDDGEKFKEQYYALNKSFNPIRFQPEEWAQTAKDCGFKYLILTTKHHDGFCLWDTRYSDYKVTAPDCPYHVSEHADLVKSMFDAFREKGLGIGAYFSKADWHTPYYRTPELPDPNPSDRGPMYSPAAEPERWENFVQYTKNQVLELCEGYGPIDILWFDAGWVCASNGQDIRLGEIVDEARKIQPGILSVDAMDSLRGLGEWLKVYGEAIYGTRVCAPYQSGNISFTRKGDAVYAIRLFPVAQESVDSKLFIPYAGKVSKVTMLDSGEDVSFVPGESGITVTVPAGRRGGSAPIALVFKLQ